MTEAINSTIDIPKNIYHIGCIPDKYLINKIEFNTCIEIIQSLKNENFNDLIKDNFYYNGNYHYTVKYSKSVYIFISFIVYKEMNLNKLKCEAICKIKNELFDRLLNSYILPKLDKEIYLILTSIKQWKNYIFWRKEIRERFLRRNHLLVIKVRKKLEYNKHIYRMIIGVWSTLLRIRKLIRKRILRKWIKKWRENKRGDCSICFEPLKDYHKTTCNHIFHYHCLLGAFYGNNKGNCPLCRRLIYLKK